MENDTLKALVIDSKSFLEHWQGHRRLTRRVIEAFPEKDLYSFTIGGMRTFSEMVMELIKIAKPGIAGVVSGTWKEIDHMPTPDTKEEILALWDEITESIDTLWPQITSSRFLEKDVAFGLYENYIYGSLLYFVDNEIHHRGQGYVYLRALGITPPPFWER
ncbi:Uncharacterized damage-inducible protein DinB (forms a four-helix bundle) [Sinomicrobium oceani]|uniref:Uncharacterized damage-inducible protein DinB (Forms a four-helix bundle) n=1 Tax=Sinomicrobium oceani TaxID=1150368 RepID=A0A1K1MRE8_9FLAO|nr:DinB family protein [Sinomicrobium oceani]SFW25754.1 Uncharacterized damage-inducible protein DinB (forms a four-helix bundle) [Sinomicrobium oceani]